jgi:hypothetical protein
MRDTRSEKERAGFGGSGAGIDLHMPLAIISILTIKIPFCPCFVNITIAGIWKFGIASMA